MARPPVKTVAEILELGTLPFAFSLCRKTTMLVNSQVDHFWMDLRSIYGRRRVRAPHLQPMADYFWMQCWLAGSHLSPDCQETYLLAHLSPYIRSIGAQKVFPDARFRAGNNHGAWKQGNARQLDALLQQAQRQGGKNANLSMTEFHSKSRLLLMRKTTSNHQRAYRELLIQLFTPQLRTALVENPSGAQPVIARWNELNGRYARHNGHEIERDVLDIFSYEASAAVRRCYSCVWNDLLPQLASKYRMDWPTVQFLRLMHLEPLVQAGRSRQLISLFHGHILGLHPAMGMMISTSTGRQILEEYVRCRTAEECLKPYRRLLGAVFLSFCQYLEHRESHLRHM